jgi:hypothetical protein
MFLSRIGGQSVPRNKVRLFPYQIRFRGVHGKSVRILSIRVAEDGMPFLLNPRNLRVDPVVLNDEEGNTFAQEKGKTRPMVDRLTHPIEVDRRTEEVVSLRNSRGATNGQ